MFLSSGINIYIYSLIMFISKDAQFSETDFCVHELFLSFPWRGVLSLLEGIFRGGIRLGGTFPHSF